MTWSALALAGAWLLAGSAALAQSQPPPGAVGCSGCHGPAGNGSAGTAMPSLAGLEAGEIAEAMRGFRDGSRPATLMARIAKGFTEEETRAIADWLAAQK